MANLYIWFTEPLSFPFMQHALLTAIIVSVVCAMLSCYLVLKSWSLMGDAISHSVLPGIIAAFVLGLPISVGAFIAGLICALLVGYLKENSRIKEDTVMGIVFSGMFALGLVLFTKIGTGQHLLHILFGHLLGIDPEEMQQAFIICCFVFVFLFIKRKDFLLYCFDPSHARVAGLSVKQLHYGLLILLSLTIISAMQVVGVILVVAMLISPGITAYLLSKRFDSMMIIAVLSAVLSSLLGTILSYHINSATGPTIILLQACFFLCALLYAKTRNYLVNTVIRSTD